jgi:CheY-like chemotaxis protein
MDRDVALAIVAIVPQLIVLAVLVIVGVRYREPIGRALGTRVTSVSVLGFKMDLNPVSIDQAVKARAQLGRAGAASEGRLVSSQEVVDRARRLAEQIVGRTILWVDDEPMGNRVERRLLRQMGIFVEAVVNNTEAKAVLDDPAESIALIISDILRADGHSGLELLADLAARSKHPDVIFYIRRKDPDLPVPQGALGIADRPDELLNLIMDGLDRMPAPARPPTGVRRAGDR